MITFVSNSVDETESFACDFAKKLLPGDIIAFKGGLGAGKTAFTRGLAKGLNCTGEVSSPTFALVHEYSGDIPLFHFDMYRINNLDDLYTTGYFDYMDMNGIMAIEWSENIEFALEDNTIYVRIEVLDENSRKIIINGDDRL